MAAVREYTMSDKRKMQDLLQADWERRIKVLTLVNQGWTMDRIGQRLGMSKQAVSQMYNKIKKMTVKEAEQIVVDLEANGY